MTPITGKKWKRANVISIQNPLNGIPSISFNQEITASFDDGTFASIEYAGMITEQFINTAEAFNLLNPLDGTVIGTSTYQDAYVMLASLYAHIAAK